MTYKYTESGRFDVALEVTDQEEKSNDTTDEIRVESNAGITASFGYEFEFDSILTVTFDASDSHSSKGESVCWIW